MKTGVAAFVLCLAAAVSAQPRWTPHVTGVTARLRGISAVSTRVAWASGDGGKHWTLQLANKDPKIFLDAMAFWDDDRGIAFSDSVDGQFVIFSTVNGGRTWDRVPAGYRVERV